MVVQLTTAAAVEVASIGSGALAPPPSVWRTRSILFVDRAPKSLTEIYRLLRAEEPWDVVIAESVDEMLALIEAAMFDVVALDLGLLPPGDGTVLRQVQERQPQTVRIVLADEGEQANTLRTMPLVHQFLRRGSPPEVLYEVICRAQALQSLLDDALLRRVVGEVGGLPAVPSVYRALTAVLESPDASLAQVAALVEQDMALAARVLQMVNSAFFGLPQRMTRIEQAVSYLGLNLLRGLVLSDEVVRALDATRLPDLPLAVLQRRGWLAAALARRMLPRAGAAETAFLGALLHDIGELVLAVRLPAVHLAAGEQARAQLLPREAAERRELGVTHAELGAYLLGLWDLPSPIVEAVAHHHAPWRVTQHAFDVLGAVYVAGALAQEAVPTGDPAWDIAEPLDLEYLAALGVLDRLIEWRGVAAALASASAHP